MSRIKSYFAIEREFERLYELLKGQLRDGSGLTDLRDQDEFRLAASRTFDQSKAWDNPSSTKIEIAHLTITSPNDPKIYEQLCV